MFSNLSVDAYKWFGLLTAVSGMAVIIVGILLAVEAPSLLVEYIYTTDGYGYSIMYVARFPILPTLIVILGALTSASAFRGYRHLSLLTSLCSGLVVTWLTSMLPPSGEHFRITKFGYPLGWLARMTPPRVSFINPPYIMGVIALPFLIDLALWSLVAWAIIFTVNRIKARATCS